MRRVQIYTTGLEKEVKMVPLNHGRDATGTKLVR
jgi:hypothetical protein